MTAPNPDQLPVLPLGQLVVYPHVVLPLALDDAQAVQLIDEVVQGNKRLLLGVVKPAGARTSVSYANVRYRSKWAAGDWAVCTSMASVQADAEATSNFSAFAFCPSFSISASVAAAASSLPA